MYHYSDSDRRFVRDRADEFRDQVRRRLNGDLSEDEFKPLRLMNGLYLQLHAYMLRVAIPYGTLSSRQLRQLADISTEFDRGYGHFTTRQNIQFNWIKLKDMPDILDRLADVDMHGIQTSGNCIRNVTADPFAGVAADEVEDARIWAEIIRQWSTLHPEFSFLPRKFKIAVTAAKEDRAAIHFHDIGLRLYDHPDHGRGFEVVVGGGQGRTPRIAKTIRAFLPVEHLLSYMEAILRTYNLFGRRDNLYKARIKILLVEQGVEPFRDAVETAWEKLKDSALRLDRDVIDGIRRRFRPPSFDRTRAFISAPAQEQPLRDAEIAAFNKWRQQNVHTHKLFDSAIVSLSLKPTGGIPGDASDRQMHNIADLADRYSSGEIRVTYRQNLVFPWVPKAGLVALWRDLTAAGLATANIGDITDIISCPGLDYCNLANARAIPLAQLISQHFSDTGLQQAIGPVTLNISGCINACGHHHAGHIGILGVDKKGVEFYQITVGGDAGDTPGIGQILGPALPFDAVVPALDRLARQYLNDRLAGESFQQAWRRLGPIRFKEAVYELN